MFFFLSLVPVMLSLSLVRAKFSLSLLLDMLPRVPRAMFFFLVLAMLSFLGLAMFSNT